MFTTLVSTAVLASRMDESVIVDCRSKLDDAAWGEQQYRTAHIPRAVYADLNRDLSGPKTGSNGRHPIPDPNMLAHTLGRFGITSGVQVVAYDQDNGMWASRLWWLLRWLGHDAAAVLDGGLSKWIAEGRPTASGVEQQMPRVFTGAPRVDMTLDVNAVASRLGSREWRLLDARAPNVIAARRNRSIARRVTYRAP